MKLEKRLLDYSDILFHENLTSEKSGQKIGKWFVKFEKLVDLLLKLNYHIDTSTPNEDRPENWLFSFIHGKYLEAPYSLHICNFLMKQGHYLNALIQLRSLLDYFVSCRYFHLHPEQIIPFMKGKKVQIGKKMVWLGTGYIYKFFSSEFYKKYYGDWLSCLSHGKGFESVYRVNRTETDSNVIMVPTFNLKHAFSLINHIVPIFYGYMKHRETFFSERLLPLPVELQSSLDEWLDWSKKFHFEQAISHPASKEWVKQLNHVIGI
jgi:hypothetical protein